MVPIQRMLDSEWYIPNNLLHVGIPCITQWQWPHTIQPSVKKVWLRLGCMEEKHWASCFRWSTKRFRVIGFGWWNWMGTPNINGSIQSETKNQCKRSFSSSLLRQGRHFSFVIHAEAEDATLSSHTTRLWGSCQVDYSSYGKIRNQARWWIHRSSTPGVQSLYLNCISKLSLQDLYVKMTLLLGLPFIFGHLWFFRKWVSLRRRPVHKGMHLLQLSGCRERLSKHWMRAWMSLTGVARVYGGVGGFPGRNELVNTYSFFFFFPSIFLLFL